MQQNIKYVDYKTLKSAYAEVRNFLEKETGGKVRSLKTKIVDDLGYAGDDNLELLEKFIQKYHLKADGFDYQKHFHTEYELFNEANIIHFFLLILTEAFYFIVYLLTFGKIKRSQIKVNINPGEREVKDMTVGDLVTWYLEKNYSLRGDVKYSLES